MADDIRMGKPKLDDSETASGDVIADTFSVRENNTSEATRVTGVRDGVAEANGGGDDVIVNQVTIFLLVFACGRPRRPI